MKKTIIETKKLCKTFSNSGIQQHVLKNLDLQIQEGDCTVIMGRSGSGKSTLLYALSGMDTPTVGDIYFEDTNISHMNNDSLALLRRHKCGFVFQAIYLLDYMNVLDNVVVCGMLKWKDRSKAADRAKELLHSLLLSEQDFSKFPSQLSGGEKQRAAIARAMINEPKVLFADEPTGALNSSASDQVLNAFTQLNSMGQTIILVTHDLKTALRGSRILYLNDGCISGSLELGMYAPGLEQDRKKQLMQFLAEMGW